MLFTFKTYLAVVLRRRHVGLLRQPCLAQWERWGGRLAAGLWVAVF